MMRLIFLSLLFTVAAHSSLVGQVPQLRFLEPVSGFDDPVDITGSGDNSDRLFIVEQAGLILIYDQANEVVLTDTFLNITSIVQRNRSERGLLGLAFHPEFASNGHFFVNYTTVARNGAADGSTIVARYTATPGANVVDASTEVVLLNIDQPFSNHNAGDLAFGPDDYLYVPTGDGGSGGDPRDSGQDPQSLLGKMLRIDVDNPTPPLNYGVPASNPFVSDGGILDEIWAFGLRNPWRISFDRTLGDLWIADVGQTQREEVNKEAAGHPGGLNYGWDCREGLIAYNESSGSSSALCNASTVYTDPVFDYLRNSSTGGFSITGGFVYRGSATNLQGWYVCADFATANFFLYPPGGGALDVQNGTPIGAPSTFGEDDNGELYVFDYGGTFYRVTTLLSMPVDLVSWSATAEEKAVKLAWKTASETETQDFVVERSQDGVTFSPVGVIPAAGNSAAALEYVYMDEQPLVGASYYRLRQRDFDGSEELFSVQTVYYRPAAGEQPVFRPNPLQRDLFVEVPQRLTNGAVTLEIFAADGKKVYTRSSIEEAAPHTFSYVLPVLSAGVYRARISYDNEVFLQNLIIR